jgi:hypothetical protein
MNLCLLYTQTDQLFYNIVRMYSTYELQLLRLCLYFEKSSTGFLLTSDPRNAVPLFTVMRKLRKPFFRPENCASYLLLHAYSPLLNLKGLAALQEDTDSIFSGKCVLFWRRPFGIVYCL